MMMARTGRALWRALRRRPKRTCRPRAREARSAAGRVRQPKRCRIRRRAHHGTLLGGATRWCSHTCGPLPPHLAGWSRNTFCADGAIPLGREGIPHLGFFRAIIQCTPGARAMRCYAHDRGGSERLDVFLQSNPKVSTLNPHGQASGQVRTIHESIIGPLFPLLPLPGSRTPR